MSKPPATWKGWERTVAKWFNATRRGADYGGYSGGKNDVKLAGWSIEVKLLSNPHWSDIVGAVHQAEAARANPDDIAVVVIRKKGQPLDSALFVMSKSFLDHFVGGVDNDSNP